MRSGGARRAITAAAACGSLLIAMAACGGPQTGVPLRDVPGPGGPTGALLPRSIAEPAHVPGVGERLWQNVPASARQVVAVYGDGDDSPDSTLVLYEKHGSQWQQAGSWAAHNGKRGWTTDHHEGDERSPVGVFSLSDAGGYLENPGALLPYTQDEDAFVTPYSGDDAHLHDFDYVIAVNYNRVPGTRPDDKSRPQGQSKGGGIWLHLDHGDGTLGCVSVPESAMEYLLRTLNPKSKPVVVMGDRADLKA
ncbi:L,D-transpeptidase family protein [Streptomyces sp. NPDC046985]|uniref:L,D-transpeptidase family protein n=1 Tax=Streptomyces sp. NPDC046985 TaxID=3155377 RepID=UPI0034118159